jgi:hypothetical protein
MHRLRKYFDVSARRDFEQICQHMSRLEKEELIDVVLKSFEKAMSVTLNSIIHEIRRIDAPCDDSQAVQEEAIEIVRDELGYFRDNAIFACSDRQAGR